VRDCQLSLQFITISRMVPYRTPSHAGTAADDSTESSSVGTPAVGLGPALRRAWLGYQLRLDSAMADAGFPERRFPDGRVLRLCAAGAGSTISAIGRELGITRQGASKVVAHLRDRGFIEVGDSATSRREKSVILTSRGIDYLQAQRTAAREIEDQLRSALGETGFSSLLALLGALDQGEELRMRTSLRNSAGSKGRGGVRKS
jgi:DNA-binding MarR family transcriptional regulator